MTMDRSRRIVVCGAGGFIGGHLIADLRRQGYTRLRAVDLKPFDRWYQRFPDVDNRCLDLQQVGACREAVHDAGIVYNLAADMGGMGFIENNKALCMLSVLINTHLLVAAREARVERFFFSSSACVYAHDKQTDPAVSGLREEDAYPAMPEDGYGWEKLFSERMCRHFGEDFGLTTRVARFHNIYGTYGTYDGGREKAPAAICAQGGDGDSVGPARDRDLGLRRADAEFHVHRRLHLRHPGDPRQRRASRSPSTWGAARRSPSISSSTSWKTSPG